ncbi:MAG: endonuclease/exonuclease/phosphatase family protein [Desulfobacterales bacterium]|nr:MAG: endonuclease/exonuclease/phosphatase family protein [Desulfobacterales bacterium]
MKLVDINVWFGMDGRGTLKIGDYEDKRRKDARFAILTTGLKNLDPDIIAIQEANKLPAYVNKLARVLNYDAVWKVANAGLKVMGWGIPLNFTAGNAILAKKGYSLQYLGAKRLSGWGIQGDLFSIHFKEMRNAMAAKVIINGQPVVIFNTQTHYSLILDETWRQAIDEFLRKSLLSTRERNRILKKIQASHLRTEKEIIKLLTFVKDVTRKHNYPFVIMGDFNTTTDSPALTELIRELGLLDPYGLKSLDPHSYTWDPLRNSNTQYDGSNFRADGATRKGLRERIEAQFDSRVSRRIDFIFLSPHFTRDMIADAQLIFTKPTGDLFVSDHYGLKVVLRDLPP